MSLFFINLGFGNKFIFFQIALYFFLEFVKIDKAKIINYYVKNNLAFFYKIINFDKFNTKYIKYAGKLVTGNKKFMKFARKKWKEIFTTKGYEHFNPSDFTEFF